LVSDPIELSAPGNRNILEDELMHTQSVLGGGTAVNSALWWKPHPNDWDVNFPAGWRYKDMKDLTEKVWGLIPGVSQDQLRNCIRADIWQRHTFHLETANSIYNKALTPSQMVLRPLASSMWCRTITLTKRIIHMDTAPSSLRTRSATDL
jgi:hypothetical protein